MTGPETKVKAPRGRGRSRGEARGTLGPRAPPSPRSWRGAPSRKSAPGGGLRAPAARPGPGRGRPRPKGPRAHRPAAPPPHSCRAHGERAGWGAETPEVPPARSQPPGGRGLQTWPRAKFPRTARPANRPAAAPQPCTPGSAPCRLPAARPSKTGGSSGSWHDPPPLPISPPPAAAASHPPFT